MKITEEEYDDDDEDEEDEEITMEDAQERAAEWLMVPCPYYPFQR